MPDRQTPSTAPTATDQSPHAPLGPGSLRPVLGLTAAAAIVVGEVIGSGIFRSPRQVAISLGDREGLILTLWVVAGLINLCGALTLAELGAMFPHAGGTYVFLKEAYGRMWAFLWTWAEFLVVRSGSIAALSVIMTISLVELLKDAGLHLSDSAQGTLRISVAVGCVISLTVVNVAGVQWGGWVQILTTVVKVGFVAFLGLLPLLAFRTPGPAVAAAPPPEGLELLAGIGSALALIMFAYDGWGNVTMVAEEIRDPQRNVPRALALGVALLIVLYTGANVAYHHTLSTTEIAQSVVPAVDVAERLLPNIGKRLTLSMMMISIFGALNGNILCGPRALFAVGRDHPRLSWLARLDPRTATPVLGTVLLSTWAIVLVILGSLFPVDGKPLYEALVDYTIFGGSLFYLAAVMAVFVLRKRRPDAPRPYRTWGYPVVPAIFAVFYVFWLGSMLWVNKSTSLIGLGLIVLGAVVYWLLLSKAEGHAVRN